MRRKLLVGNWKMNSSLAANTILLNGIKAGMGKTNCEVAVCVPAPYFAQCQTELTGTNIAWGAQDVSMHDIGPYTGEISVAMLRDFGCRYVVIGHSERRINHGESDQTVAEKARRAITNGITPIICVGETLAQREAGQTAEVVGKQLDVVLAAIEPDDLWGLVIAYEPVWAIGTGKTATPQMAQEVHALLRAKLSARNSAAASTIPILYGGSLRPDNAREIMQMHDIDGCLVGGASLNANDFLAIANAA
jgi:triosephosphate isomerase (TIM)